MCLLWGNEYDSAVLPVPALPSAPSFLPTLTLYLLYYYHHLMPYTFLPQYIYPCQAQHFSSVGGGVSMKFMYWKEGLLLFVTFVLKESLLHCTLQLLSQLYSILLILLTVE